jgi:RNA polymerase sigma factor (sigma-70 family)
MSNRLLPQLVRIVLSASPAVRSDSQLLGDFLSTREESAFRTLVLRHGPMVLGVCRRILSDGHLAEDAFQATFLVLARRAGSIVPREQVGPWLYGVATRTAWKARGQSLRRLARESTSTVPPEPVVYPDESWDDVLPILDEEIARLPEKLRLAVVLCDLQGRPQRQVAKELGIPVSTLANRLAAARRQLAARLTDRGVTLSVAGLSTLLAGGIGIAIPPTLTAATIRSALGTEVPPAVSQLSEGVMKMFAIHKLRSTIATTVLGSAFLLLAGLIAAPVLQAEPTDKAKTPPKTASASGEAEVDDLTWLIRLSKAVRQTDPTEIEKAYFLSDADKQKRSKVRGWMTVHGSLQNCNACHQDVTWKGHSPDDVRIWHQPHDGKVQLDNSSFKVQFERFSLSDVIQHAVTVGKQPEAGDVVAIKAPGQPVAKDTATPTPAATSYLETLTGIRKTLVELQRLKPDVRTEIEKIDLEIAKLRANRDRLAVSDLSEIHYFLAFDRSEDDAAYLTRWMRESFKRTPTNLETRYFLDDKDPKKRQKLAGWTGKPALPPLSDAAGETGMLKTVIHRGLVDDGGSKATEHAFTERATTKWTRLVDQVGGTNLPADRKIESLFLAVLARFPTETEKTILTGRLSESKDPKATLAEIVKSLRATAEAK